MHERCVDFERDGFVVIPEFASVSACAELREAAERCVAEVDLEGLSSIFDAGGQSHGHDPWFLNSGGEVRAFLEPERDQGELRVNKLGHALHDRLPVFDRFSRDPRLATLVTQLGIRAPLLLQSMVIFKHPRIGGEVPAHQDSTYLRTRPLSVIGLWFALDDATADNGCLEVLPGGHRLGLRCAYRRDGARTWTEELDPSPLPSSGWRPLEVKTGTLVAFHGLLPHRSQPNRSSQARCAYTLHVIDGEAEYSADNWLQRPPQMPLRGFTSDLAPSPS